MSFVDTFDVISYKSLDTSKLSLSNLITEDKQGNPKKQNQFYINYEEKGFLVCSPNIKIEYGGIPHSDYEFVQSEDDRKVVTLPLNVNTDLEVTRETQEENDKRSKELTLLKEKLSAIDEYLQEPEVVKKLFNTTNPSKFSYPYPIVKQIKDRGDAFKLKFKYEYPQITLNKLDDKEVVEIPKEDIQDVDSFAEYVKFLSTGKYTFGLRGWAHKKPKGKQPIEYGVTLTLYYVKVNETAYKAVTNNAQRFVDTSEEENEDDIEEGNSNESLDESLDENVDENVDELEEIKPKRRSRKKAS